MKASHSNLLCDVGGATTSSATTSSTEIASEPYIKTAKKRVQADNLTAETDSNKDATDQSNQRKMTFDNEVVGKVIPIDQKETTDIVTFLPDNATDHSTDKLKIMPRRSLRLIKMRAEIVTAAATSTIDTAPKRTGIASKKRPRTERIILSETEANNMITAAAVAANQPNPKKMKLMTPNLEYLPSETLQKIFAEIEDGRLLRLAEMSRRFAGIVQTVFKKRYANQYFVIDDERNGGDPEVYLAQLKLIGHSIKAIRMNRIESIDENHWITKILNERIINYEKVIFDNCTFKSEKIDLNKNITHLTIRNDYIKGRHLLCKVIDLPECHNLKELEICGMLKRISYSSLERIIRNNPSLQSLKICYSRISEYGRNETECNLLTLIGDHLADLKKLVLENNHIVQRHLSRNQIDGIVKSFKHLESLSLSFSLFWDEFFDRLKTECGGIKHLELLDKVIYFDGRFFEAAFQQIESLSLLQKPDIDPPIRIVSARLYSRRTHRNKFNPGHYNNINGLVRNLPNLRHLRIQVLHGYKINPNILPWLRECPSLEIVTNVIDPDYKHHLMNAQFFEKFIETITISGKPNARIEMMVRDQVIVHITRNGIVFRNKLIHWIGCDQNQSLSERKMNLLDLAKHPVKSNAEQANLLFQILDYLDVSSLSLFAKASKPGKQLVGKYIEHRSQYRWTTTFTDEFRYIDLNFYTSSRTFAKHITDLHVYLYYDDTSIGNRKTRYKNLKKLSIHNGFPRYWPDALPKVENIFFDSAHSVDYTELHEIFKRCPNVEIIELRKAGLFDGFIPNRNGDHSYGNDIPLKFPKLKKFIFDYRGETQMKNLKSIFAKTNVKLVPIY